MLLRFLCNFCNLFLNIYEYCCCISGDILTQNIQILCLETKLCLKVAILNKTVFFVKRARWSWQFFEYLLKRRTLLKNLGKLSIFESKIFGHPPPQISVSKPKFILCQSLRQIWLFIWWPPSLLYLFSFIFNLWIFT